MFGAFSNGRRLWTLWLSISAHAGVAWVATHASDAGTMAPAAAPTSDRPAPELEVANPTPKDVDAERAPAARGHAHPYPVLRSHDATPHDPSLNHQPTITGLHDAPPAAGSTVVDAAAPLPRFVLTVGGASHLAGGVTSVEGVGRVRGAAAADDAVAEPFADSPATLLTGNAPAYTREAEVAGVEADVPLEIVVNASGAVVSARVLRRVGYGLDEVALRGVRGYLFSPARREGRPIPVRMRWSVRFQLR
jgi:protein TonB